MNSIVEIPIDKIRTPAFQRNLNQKYVSGIVKQWNDLLMNPIHVNLRPDGFYYVFDGNHTEHAFAIKYPDKKTIPAIVYEGLTYEDEAKMFIKLNDGHKKPNFNEQLWAKIESGDEFANEYFKILKGSGIKFAFDTANSRGTYGMTAHKAAMNLLKRFGRDVVFDSFTLIENSKIDNSEKYRNYTIKAIASFLGVTKSNSIKVDSRLVAKTIDSMDIQKDIIKVVSSIKPNSASCGTDGNINIFGFAFCQAYNKHTRAHKINSRIFLE